MKRRNIWLMAGCILLAAAVTVGPPTTWLIGIRERAKREPEPMPIEFFRVSPTVERSMVPGGWLVAYMRQGVTFVPDPDHKWVVVLKEKQ